MKKLKIIALVLVVMLTLSLGAYTHAVVIPEKREAEELARLLREYREAKLAIYREENERYADFEVDVAFIGDSLTDGYDLAAYYPGFTVANRGIGGDTTYDLEARLSESVYELSPRVVVMLIGANNLKTMLENYENILIGLKENLPETKVVLVSLTSMGGSWAHNNQLAAFNNVTIKKLAEKYSFTFVDLYTPLFDETRGEIYPQYTTDGGHLTPAGYTVFTEQLTPVLKKLLSEE